MRGLTVAIVTLAFLIRCAPSDAAIVIADFQKQIDVPTEIPREIYLHLEDGNAFENAIFENILITPASAGSSFDANAANDPDFASLTAELTNGTNQTLWRGYSRGPGLTLGKGATGELESSAFGLSGLPDIGDPDLSGYTISNIRMSVLSITLGADVDDYLVEFQFSGEQAAPNASLPEPGSFLLFAGLGLASLMARRRGRRGLSSASCNLNVYSFNR